MDNFLFQCYLINSLTNCKWRSRGSFRTSKCGRWKRLWRNSRKRVFVSTNNRPPTGALSQDRKQDEDFMRQGIHTGICEMPPCVYCCGDHPLPHCTTCFYLPTSKTFLRRSGQCLCLKGGHGIGDCKLKYHCNDCGSMAHHVLIWEKTAPPP